MPVRELHLRFTEDDAGQVRTRLVVDGDEAAPIEGNFDFDRRPKGRNAEVLAKIEADRCDSDDLRDLGSQLWTAVMSGDIGERFERLRQEPDTTMHLRLSFPERRRSNRDYVLPLSLDALPWEALYDERGIEFLAGDPRYCVIREPPRVNAPGSRARTGGSFGILAVIPVGSGLDTEREWRNLQFAVERLRLDKNALQRIDGAVTQERLQQKLAERPWDVVHFIGHGEPDTSERIRIRLNSNDGGDLLVEPEMFAALFKGAPPRLMVANCCRGGGASGSGSLSGLAPSLFKAGVGAVVAMRYDIEDDFAILFSETFYRELIAGPHPGHPEIAIREARRALFFQSVRGFITPVLFKAHSDEALLQFASTKTERPEIPAKSKFIDAELPKDLVRALREGRCVPVLGAGLLGKAVTRRGSPPPTLERVARLLAEECGYPHTDELEGPMDPCSWRTTFVLQSICQHFEERLQDRYALTRAIRSIHENIDPPPSFAALAGWQTAGYVCTHYDGLLEEALRRAGKTVHTLNTLATVTDTRDSMPLLVNLRGSHAAPSTLRLTLEDDDELWDQLGRIPSRVIEMTNAEGVSLLFVGLSPRDRFARRLATALLLNGPRNARGPTYFVCDKESELKDPYWRSLRIKWLRADANEFILGLSGVLA